LVLRIVVRHEPQCLHAGLRPQRITKERKALEYGDNCYRRGCKEKNRPMGVSLVEEGTKRATRRWTSRVSTTQPRSAPAQRTFWPISRSSIPLVNMAITNFKLLICLLILSESTLAQAQAECLRTVSELKANNVKARWQETTQNDGKPLTISIADGANGLVYSARKADVLWLTGSVSVCRSGGATEITLTNTQATSNVPMLARVALPSTQSARIVNDQIKLGGAGWGGTFIGQ
jgi:hypothetical protein